MIPQHPRSESPTSLHLNPSLAPVADSYMTKKPFVHASLYNSLHPQSVNDADTAKLPINGFAPMQYPTSTSFNAFGNPRQRQSTAPAAGLSYRDSFAQAQPYPTAVDVFGPGQATASQPPHHPLLDPISPGRLYDYDPSIGLPASKAHFNGVPIPPDNRYGSSSALLQSQQVQVSKGLQSSQPGYPGFTAPNGIHSSQLPAQYPAHVSTQQPAQSGLSNVQGAQGEEISTIFVVGFPDDMQEREFQNMFTFSAGFEAATLKIPNKDLNAYGGGATGQSAAQQLRPAGYHPSTAYPNGAMPPSAFSADSYAMDGSSPWPSASHPDDHFNRSGAVGMVNDLSAHVPTMPPRKQIIGFAKFKTRAEAIEARDILQGRRVDIEKGAVLKAEMAKKNLHTKRGVGPLGLPMALMGNGGTVGPDALAHLSGINGLVAPPSIGNGEALAQRERELGALGAMGLAGVSSRGRERERMEDEEKHRRSTIASMTLADASRSAMSRDDEEKERRRKEKEMSKPRMSAYDAFHSVPANMTRPSNSQPGPGPLSPNEQGPLAAFPFATPASAGNGMSVVQPFSSQDVFAPIGTSGTWGKPERYNSHKPSPTSSGGPPQSSSSSPPTADSVFASTNSLSSHPDQRTLSPDDQPAPLPHYQGLPSRSASNHSYSPPPVGEYIYPHDSQSIPTSSSSSVVGSQNSDNEEMTRSMGSLSMEPHNGMTSPQLPSPASGGSSTTTNARTNGSDQNPPINTLYVGNLPTSPPANLPANHLEESLRSLFQRCPGYRKLCFRQKSNGPMCFVEFEDVSYAARAIGEMYGDTLGGIVKTGIRLSYSKNPLGVRTPTNGSSAAQRQEASVSTPLAMHETFHSRQGPSAAPMSLDLGQPRSRDELGMAAGAAAYNYPASPPSRFFPSPPPGRASFSVQPQPMSAAFSRPSQQVFGPPTATSPPQGYSYPSSNLDERFLPREMSSNSLTPSPGLEMARAG